MILNVATANQSKYSCTNPCVSLSEVMTICTSDYFNKHGKFQHHVSKITQGGGVGGEIFSL